MNSKSIVKRTLPLIIALAVIIILALVFTLLSGEKANPKISNPEGIFMKSGDVEINNEQIYTELKQSYGYSVLVDMMDRYLLGQTKDANNKSYYVSLNQLSEDELQKIEDRIEKTIFSSGRTGNDENDQKTITNWKNNMFMNLGLKDDNAIKDYFNLAIAKENYVRDQIRNKYNESVADDKITDTISENEIKAYYENNYRNEHWTIIVPFNTTKAAKNALLQLGIEIKQIKDESNKNITAWVHGGTETQLTAEEVKQAFISLYNNAYSYKAVGYPNAGNPTLNNVIREGVHYSLQNGKIVFNTDFNEDLDVENIQEDSNLFHYTMAELNALNANLGDYVNRDLRSISNEASTLLQTYSVNSKAFTGSTVMYYVLKIAHEEAPAAADVKEEVISKIIDNRISAQQTLILNELRTSYADKGGFIIYDTLLEANYIAQNSSHSSTKKKSETVILQIGDLTITADQLFEELSKRFGEIEAVKYYGYEYLLYSEYNTIYEYKGRFTEGKVKDQDAWDDILDLIDLEKHKLATGQYQQNGYPASYSWKEFLKDYFKVESEQELKMAFLYQEVQKEFAKAMAETTQDVWNDLYLPNMNKAYDEYINATGMHLLIHRQDAKGNLIDPKDWTPYEIAAAEELYDLVIDILETSTPAQLKTQLQSTILNEYTNAPRFLANLEQIIANQPVQDNDNKWLELTTQDYKYSKFKSSGFLIKFEELTTVSSFMGNPMVEPFEDAVREIWDEAMNANQSGEYIRIYEGYSQDYLVTQFGYHVYLNLTVTGRPTGTVNDEQVPVEIPTRENVLKYEEDTNHGDLDAFIKKGITTYYSPIRKELTGQYYPLLRLNLQLLEDIDNTQFQRFPSLNNKDSLERALELYNNAYYSQLKYVKNPADGE